MDDDRAEQFASALSHHRAGRHTEAAAGCRALLARDAEDAAALYLAGLAHYALGETDEAIALMRRLVVLRPESGLGQAALARLLVAAGRYGEAVGSYQAAVTLAPEDAALASGLAGAQSAVGDLAAAIATCEAALARMPGETVLLASLGRALLAAGQNAAVIAALTNASGAEISFLRGTAHKALGALDAAIGHFRTAIAADPAHAAAHLGLGNALAARGRFAEAQEALMRAVAIAPTLAEAQASLGAVLLRTGEEDAAEQALRRALSIDPNLVAAHRNLAATAAAKGAAAEARAHRDAAYRRQRIFVEPAAAPHMSVLVLTTATGGNVPTQFLLPRERCTKVGWVIEYAAAGEEDSLPPYDLVFNGMGDADAASPAEEKASRFLARCRVPVLNAPERVTRTRRDRLPGLLGGIPGISVPAVQRIATPRPRAGEVMRSGIGLPLLVRGAESHGGQGLRLVGSVAALEATLKETPLYLTQFWPFRSADGFFRKYRMIFIDRKPLPCHLAIGRYWLLHYATAGMEQDPARQAEETLFLSGPERVIGARAMEGVRAIGERLDLDFAGLDFALLPDGNALVFEANATMLVHPEPETGPLAYRNEAVRRILDAFAGMIARRLGEEMNEGRGRAPCPKPKSDSTPRGKTA